MTPTPFDRERRFILPGEAVDAFLAATAARLAPGPHDPARPIAYTRTTYLDTERLDYLRSCDGPAARRLRIREYASTRAPAEPPRWSGPCFLELKESRGEARTKARLGAPRELIARLVAGDVEIDPELRRLVDGSPALAAVLARLDADRPRPVVTTWYRRRAFHGEEGSVRVTVDEEILFCRPAPLGEVGGAARRERVIARGPERILEVKHTGALPRWLVAAAAALPEPRPISKFGLGMCALQRLDRPSPERAAP